MSKNNNLVDEAGKESFPASDPPTWTTGREPTDEEKKKEKQPTSPTQKK